MTEIDAHRLAQSLRNRGFYVRVDLTEDGYDVSLL